MKTPLILLLLSWLVTQINLPAQTLLQDNKFDWGYAIKAHFAFGKRQASFYNLSLAIGVSKQIRWKEVPFSAKPGMQTTVNFYSKGLGTSIFDCYNRRGQLDVLASFYIVGGYDDRASIRQQYVRLFNQLSASTIWHDYEGAVSYGTSFLVNNNGRNQQLGHLGFNIDQVVVGYYNDGFWPFNKFASDLFDRYWTGGGYFGIGLSSFGNKWSKKNPWMGEQYVEFAYDRFTGAVQSDYKLSKELLFDLIPQSDIQQAFSNRALTSLSLRNINGSSAGIGLIGQCPKCDIQDKIHQKLGYSRHPSLSKCLFVVQGSLQFNNHPNFKP